MDQILNIRVSEKICVDQDRLTALYTELGEAGAEDVVCRAMEELATRLSHCSRLHRLEEWESLRKCVRSLIAISDQIGMVILSRVCCDVIHTIDYCDRPASAATLARLLRIGDQSLSAIWELEDITI